MQLCIHSDLTILHLEQYVQSKHTKSFREAVMQHVLQKFFFKREKSFTF